MAEEIIKLNDTTVAMVTESRQIHGKTDLVARQQSLVDQLEIVERLLAKFDE